ncbi:galactokinase [Candidatus Wolfebacteria bacterium]|nr:galactokinase [Candidatus Wolfebacteria bacterium]
MILTRTPFRLQLGGGSTDLPAYYEAHGGFIFAAAINLYMYISVNRAPIDDLIRLKYSETEEVGSVSEIKNNFIRLALQHIGIGKRVEITSTADAPGGTGLGSSASFLVGLLNALHVLKGEKIAPEQLAEEGFEIAVRHLKLPDGKQDFYAAALGDFCVLEIVKDGKVDFRKANVSQKTREEFEKRMLLFYSGIKRSSVDILHEQQTRIREENDSAIELKHETKRIGREILSAFETDSLDKYGVLLHEHWGLKKKMSANMSSLLFDNLYERARKKGALGGKIVGAGGGGFFMVFCQDGAQDAVREIYQEANFKAVPFKVEAKGTQVLLNCHRD